MDRRCAAGALLALAACIATTAAAPTASNQTALDLYEGASEGCYYNFQHYGEGDRIMTNEPCLNCTCHNRMLMCYLRVCPFTKPIGQDCSVEKRADQCCPIVTCPDVPVDLLTSTTSSPSEYGETGVGKLDRYGCSINGKYFPEGSKVPPSPNKPCEHCYCIRNMTTCVMQECTLHVDGCTPIYRKDVCCPVRYSCDHSEDEIPLLDDMTTTVRPTPGFLLTTTLAPVTQMTQDCVHDEKIFADGALIKTEKACEHCYCMKGDIVCVVQECGTPMENEGKNCTSMPPREGQCCPDTYICEGDEMTTETKPDIATVTPFEDIATVTPMEDMTTLTPPRRVSVEGSGYRSETDKPSTEGFLLEPDTEGSGEDQPFKPTDASDMLIPESETSPPLIVTDEDEIQDNYSPSTTEVPESEQKTTEKATTEADKGENTVPSGDFEEDSSEKPSIEIETTTTKEEVDKDSFDEKTTASPKDETFVKDKTTQHEDIGATEPAIISESTTSDHELHTSPDSMVTSEVAETTVPSRRKENEETMPEETTTSKHLEESTTKAYDITAPDAVTTESVTSPLIEQVIKTTTSQITEEDKGVKGPTTESHVEITTEFDVIKPDTQSTTTVQPEIATELTSLSKVDFSETTSANPIENEIDEDSFPTLAPGRIPGEGDCLLDGVTYSHESIVPSSSNCHTSCRCISSIVKCEPIVCSPPPDYMDNCQPMYDSPESCCPTYVCDHPRETVPPQSHSQMAGTESPIPTPAIECNGDQCDIIKDKEETKPSIPCTSEGCTDDSNKKADECGPQGCGDIVIKPEEVSPAKPTHECNGDSCSSTPEDCASGKCEAAIPKDQTCNNENGCEIPVVQTCQGADCAIEPDITASKDDSKPCDNPEGCVDQKCNNEKGCEIPVTQPCHGDDCRILPDITTAKDGSAPCDNPEGCKNVQTPEIPPQCEGESCISELPSQVTQESPDCKDGNDCGQSNQIPTIGECNEEECKTQHVPEINKSPSSDCSDTTCIPQQDNLPHVTVVPEFSTESGPRVTVLPEELETKPDKLVTEVPKTTDYEKEIEPTATTKTSIPEKEEESGTTMKYDEIDNNKEKEIPSTIPESYEIVTQATEGQREESTEIAQKETTMVTLHDITKLNEIPEVTSALPTTELTSSSDKDTKEITTELPSVVEIEPHGSTTERTIEDKDRSDIATTEATIDSSAPEITQDTTKSPEMLTVAPETLDRDGHEKPTKEPEYVQDTEEKVTEPTERYTSSPDQITDKAEVQPIPEQESQGASTTPESYESQTITPEITETASPEIQSTSPQDEDKKSPELPLSTLAPEELLTGKPEDTQNAGDISLPDTTEKVETTAPEFAVDEATSKPEILLDSGSETQPPESSVSPSDESITKAPHSETTGELDSDTETPKPLLILPQETSAEESDVDNNRKTPSPVIVDIQTQTPMSIVKDHSEDEVSSTLTPKPAITTEPALPEPTTVPAKSSSEVPDIGKMPSVSDEESTATTIESSADDLGISAVTVNVVPSKSPTDGEDKTAIPEIETSTDSLEPSATEANLQESSVPQEDTSDDIGTKLPASITESSVQSTTEEGEIVTTPQEQLIDHEVVTELPELIVHEHPTESSSIEKESEQPATEATAIKEPQEIKPEKETSDEPTPQNAVTVVPEIPESVSQEEGTEEPNQESVTKATESSKPETTESKLDGELSHTPESSATEPQKEVTETPELQATTVLPEVIVTDAQKEMSETPAMQTTITSIPKVSDTELQETVTESQPSVTEINVLVTQPSKDATNTPVSNDMVTIPFVPSTDTASEPDQKSPATPEEQEIHSPKDTTKLQDITTTSPETLLTESYKESTKTPELQYTVTEVTGISTDKPVKEVSEQPKLQDADTIAPEQSVTERQEETTKPSGITDGEANVPEDTPKTQPKDGTTEAPVVQDQTTSAPELYISEEETVPVEDTKIPVIEEDITDVPELSVTEPPKSDTEAPAYDASSSGVPEVHTTETQIKVTEAPAVGDMVTNVPETLMTESHKDTESPETQDTVTSSSESPETEPKKETSESPESQEVTSTIPEKSETEPKKETTEIPEAPSITDAPEISSDTTKAPEAAGTDSQKDVTNTPEAQDMPTAAPPVMIETPTVSEKEGTETQEPLEESVTEGHNKPTEPSEVLTIESQKPATELPDISLTVTTNAPEMIATKSDTEITEASEQTLSTKPEFMETETEPEKSAITEKEESVTEPPVRITTKLDDHTEPESHELITPTESSKPESVSSVTTEGASPMEPDTEVTESLATEYPVKIIDPDTETEKPAPSTLAAEEKPHEGQEIETEIPFVEPALTETPISESIQPETNAPGLIDTELGATETPKSPVTEKQDTRRTESINVPGDESVTKAPETLTHDKTTAISEESQQTTKGEYAETTPDSVLLEEHTHKTVSPGEQTSTSSSDLPSKVYEPTTPEVTETDIVTESTPSTDSEKPPQENVVPDKDYHVPESTETTIPESSTEDSRLVSGEITTITPLHESHDTAKPQIEESNEISTSTTSTGDEGTETEKPSVPSVEPVSNQEVITSEKPQDTIAPEDEFIVATTKTTTMKAEEESTTLSPLLDKFGKPEKPKPDVTEEVSKPEANEVQPTEEALAPEEESHFPPSGTSGYGQEPDYGEEDSFGPGTCRYGGKVYVSAQQIPRDDPCDFCFCFRSDIICLQQSCPPPIHGCHEEPIQGFCCPRYECPVSMATTLNVTTTTTTTTTTLPPHFLPHAYKGAAQRRGCQIKGHTYKVGEVVRASSGPCLHCTCGGDGQMKCDPKVCTPEPMLRQMIAAAVSAKRRR